jgi:hypothetical protein
MLPGETLVHPQVLGLFECVDKKIGSAGGRFGSFWITQSDPHHCIHHFWCYNFSSLQEQIGQVGGGVYLTLAEQLIGSYDPRMLLGYELSLDCSPADFSMSWAVENRFQNRVTMDEIM